MPPSAPSGNSSCGKRSARLASDDNRPPIFSSVPRLTPGLLDLAGLVDQAPHGRGALLMLVHLILRRAQYSGPSAFWRLSPPVFLRLSRHAKSNYGGKMKQIVPVVLLGAATMLAASALAQTTTKPPARPAMAAKQAAATTRAPAKPGVHPTILPRRPVFVPPPPVIELDEMAVVSDLPTVLDNDTRDRYRRIFQAQAAGQFAQADAEIAQLKDKILMGYVGAQRLLSPGHTARYDELAAWLQEYNDHPDAPAIYRLALARRTPGSAELTPASFVSQAPPSPTFAAARTVTGADAARAAELRARLQGMADDGGFNAAFVLLDRKSTADVLGPQEVELWRGRMRTRALEADSQRSVQVPVEVGMPPDANWNAGPVGLHPRQHGRRRASLRDGGRCLARPGLVVDTVGRFVLGGTRQPAGRQSAEVRALSQARRPARPHLLRPDRPEGARHADRAGLERAAARPPHGPRCCATTAPAAARWRCCSSAPRRQPSASCSAARSTPIRSMSRPSSRSP